MTASCITFRSPRVSHVFLYGHKVITEAVPRHVGGSISVTGVESMARERERAKRASKESRDGQAGVTRRALHRISGS